ncbi:phosphatidylinositol-glycan-specific phospholipase D [Gastrophryne carolinensis]
MMAYVTFLAFSLLSLQPATACGISTHIEIAHRALEYFSVNEGKVDYRELIRNHPDAFQAGSVYPDAFYQGLCAQGKYHYVSEDSHWTPFLKTSIDYIRRTYPLPWDEGAQKLVAFIFGIASHMVADVTWHSLHIKEGFLRAMAAIDFHGSYSKAHQTGDFGGDVLSQFELDFNYLESKWYIPVKDLFNIYQEFYSATVIEERTIIDCTYIMFLQLYGEYVAVSRLYPTYARSSPFLVERFHEYFLGGVEDMAFWTTNIFQLTSFMLDNGTSDCYLPENPVFVKCNVQTKYHKASRRVEFEKTEYYNELNSSDVRSSGADVVSTESGVYFQMNHLAQTSSQAAIGLIEEMLGNAPSPFRAKTAKAREEQGTLGREAVPCGKKEVELSAIFVRDAEQALASPVRVRAAGTPPLPLAVMLRSLITHYRHKRRDELEQPAQLRGSSRSRGSGRRVISPVGETCPSAYGAKDSTGVVRLVDTGRSGCGTPCADCGWELFHANCAMGKGRNLCYNPLPGVTWEECPPHRLPFHPSAVKAIAAVIPEAVIPSKITMDMLTEALRAVQEEMNLKPRVPFITASPVKSVTPAVSAVLDPATETVSEEAGAPSPSNGNAAVLRSSPTVNQVRISGNVVLSLTTRGANKLKPAPVVSTVRIEAEKDSIFWLTNRASRPHVRPGRGNIKELARWQRIVQKRCARKLKLEYPYLCKTGMEFVETQRGQWIEEAIKEHLLIPEEMDMRRRYQSCYETWRWGRHIYTDRVLMCGPRHLDITKQINASSIQLLSGAAQVMKAVTLFNSQSSSHISSPSATYFVTSPYSRLGWALITADLNQDGWEDLVIGAPGFSSLGNIQVGSVYVVYGNESGLPSVDMDLDKEANIMLRGTEPSGRFGSSVAVLDFNVDGLPDLAVGAPSVGGDKLIYTGAVYIFFGVRGGNLSSQANVTIKCKHTYCNLGWSLLAADVTQDQRDDLVIGSPYAPGGGKQRGLVAAFSSHRKRSAKDTLFAEEAEWSMVGEQDYAWFGFSLHSHKGKTETLLVIGSPTWSTNKGFDFEDIQSVGKVYGIYPPEQKTSFVINGDAEQSKMGSSFSSGTLEVNGDRKQVLLIGAPTQNTVSKTMFLSRELHNAGTSSVYELKDTMDPSLLGTLRGNGELSRYGTKLHLRDLDGDGLDEIIVTTPLRTYEFASMLPGSQRGRVYVYNGNTTSTGLIKGRCKSWTSPCPEDWAQYVLISPDDKSRFGSTVATVSSKQREDFDAGLISCVRRINMVATSQTGRLLGLETLQTNTPQYPEFHTQEETDDCSLPSNTMCPESTLQIRQSKIEGLAALGWEQLKLE